MAKPHSVLRLLAAGSALVLSVMSCGSPCPFGLLSRRQYTNNVPCCGTSVRQDFAVPANVELEVSNGQSSTDARVDVWVTRADCAQVFNGPYPPPSGTAPLCAVVMGPIVNGVTSARQPVAPGTFRLHLYGYSTNVGAAQSVVEVGQWGEDCSGTAF
jgi:hypothetical protein